MFDKMKDNSRWFAVLAATFIYQSYMENVDGFFYKGAWEGIVWPRDSTTYSAVSSTHPYLAAARGISHIRDQSELTTRKQNIFDYIKKRTRYRKNRKINFNILELLRQVLDKEDKRHSTDYIDALLAQENQKQQVSDKRTYVNDKGDASGDIDEQGSFRDSNSQDDDDLEDAYYMGDDWKEEPSETALMKESLDRPVPLYSLYHGRITLQDDGDDKEHEDDDYDDGDDEDDDDDDDDDDVGVTTDDDDYALDKAYEDTKAKDSPRFIHYDGLAYPYHYKVDYLRNAKKPVLYYRKKRDAQSSRPSRKDTQSGRHSRRDAQSSRPSRRKNALIEMVVVVDNALYRDFLQRDHGDIQRTMNDVRKYVTVTMAMANIRYATIKVPELRMKIILTGIVVAQTRHDAPWIEPLVQYYHGKAAVDADTALHQFQKWLPKQKDLPSYDHALALTGYTLVRKGRYTARGMANVATICQTDKGLSSSLINDRADFQTAHVVAHELGHVLGANHDGSDDSKRCPPDHDYVMSPSASYSDNTFQNAHYFSSCSITQFRIMLRKPQANCLFNKAKPVIKYALWKNPPGREYSLDTQCQLVFGEKSGFCEGDAMKEVVCRRLWCKDPTDGKSCRTNALLAALPGTKCAKGMHCRSKTCVPKGARRRSLKVSRIQRKTRKTNRKQKALKANRKPRVRNRMKTGTRPRQRSRPGSRTRNSPHKPCVLDRNSQYCRREVQKDYSICKRKRYQRICCRTCTGLT